MITRQFLDEQVGRLLVGQADLTRRACWHVTVVSDDAEELLHHSRCEDLKEVQAVATEVRHHSRTVKIWISRPNATVYSWD